MEQKAVEQPTTPKMDFSRMSSLAIVDYNDMILDRVKAFAEIIEFNSLEGYESFDTLKHDAIAKLAWQILENLEIVEQVNCELWERYKQATA